MPLRIRRIPPPVNAAPCCISKTSTWRRATSVSYYVRARDLARGKKSSESRSDIFFLEVRPFEEEFTLAPDAGGAGRRQRWQTRSSRTRQRT